MSEVVQKTKLDTIKWFFIWTILVSAVIANYYFSSVAVSIRLIGWLLLLLLVLGLISLTQKGKVWGAFVEESKKELRKIVWPTRQETIQTTIVVVLTVVIAALFLWVVDAVLVQCVQFLTSN